MLFQLISSPTQRERGNISKYLVCHILSFSSKLHILSRVATKLVLSWDILHFARQTWQSWLQLEYQTVKVLWQKKPLSVSSCLFELQFFSWIENSQNLIYQEFHLNIRHSGFDTERADHNWGLKFPIKLYLWLQTELYI